MTDQGLVLFGCMRNRGDVLARNDQHVHRRLRIDVGKSVALIVLVDGLGGNAPVDDPAKEAAHDYGRVYRTGELKIRVPSSEFAIVSRPESDGGSIARAKANHDRSSRSRRARS